MQQLESGALQPETDEAADGGRLVHENLYISDEHGARLKALKGVNKKRIIQGIRQAAQDEIDRQWRLLKSIGGRK